MSGTPSRPIAAARRARLLRVIKSAGAIRRSRIAEYFPEIGKHAMDKHIQHLRQAGLIEIPKFGVWRATRKEMPNGR